MPNKSQKSQTDLEWESRTLCSDDSCIGIIGPDGRCLECGRPYGGELPDNLAAAIPPTDMAADATEEDGDPEASSTEPDGDAVEEPQSDDSEWAARKLCPDESCIGVIGSDGRCLECGRAAEDG
ncbi:hypothetical protein ACFL5W_00125 [Thermodesulfobacteriota bacterium]